MVSLKKYKMLHNIAVYGFSFLGWIYIYCTSKVYDLNWLQRDPEEVTEIINVYNYLFATLCLLITFGFAFVGYHLFKTQRFNLLITLLPVNVLYYIGFVIARYYNLNQMISEKVSQSMAKFELGTYALEFITNVLMVIII